MKKIICLLLIAAAAFLLTGCSNPDSLRLDLSQGYGDNLKLIHLNASIKDKKERMEAFGDVIRNAEALDKDFSLFAYYPDYLLEISPWDNGKDLTVVVDLNGDYVDFYFPGPYPEESPVIYRSKASAEDFKTLVHKG